MHWKRPFFAMLVAAGGMCVNAAAEPVVVLEDDFSSLAKWKDLSLAPQWGGFQGPTSAFEITADGDSPHALSPTDVAMTKVSGVSDATTLRSFTTIDHQFATPIDHALSIVNIEFRMRWVSPDTGSGESARVVISLTHDYPAGGLDLTHEPNAGSRVADFTADNMWARPAYQVRLRSSTTSNGRSILQYGGGLDPQGEWERVDDDWWLPGFNSAPGGGSPGGAKGHVFTDTGLASSGYQHFRYVITPERHEIWVDHNGNGLFEEHLGEMHGFQDLTADPDNPDFFQYFETFEGLRIYFRGGSDVFLDTLAVTVTPIPEPATLTVLTAGAALLVFRRRRGRHG